MSAAKKINLPDVTERPALRILRPENEHRTSSPGDGPRSPMSGGELEKWQTAHSEESRAKLVGDDEREVYAVATTLRQFYEHCRSGLYDAIGRRGRKDSSEEKDRQAISAWERATRPSDWSSQEAWLGPSLSFIESASSAWLFHVFERMRDAVGLSVGSVNGGIRGSLLTILNHAVKVRAITRRPSCERLREAQRLADIYSEEDVEQTVDHLLSRGHDDVAVAFLFDLHVGLRSSDLFAAKRESIRKDVRGRPVFEITATKTEKHQLIPIAPAVMSMIDRHCVASGPLFPAFFSDSPKRPSNTKPARRRNEFLKEALASAGINRTKPWQCCRATCNERLESLKEGVGQFVLGHSAKGVNARSYRNPTEIVYRTVNEVPLYSCLKRLAGLVVETDYPIGSPDSIS